MDKKIDYERIHKALDALLAMFNSGENLYADRTAKIVDINEKGEIIAIPVGDGGDKMSDAKVGDTMTMEFPGLKAKFYHTFTEIALAGFTSDDFPINTDDVADFSTRFLNAKFYRKRMTKGKLNIPDLRDIYTFFLFGNSNIDGTLAYGVDNGELLRLFTRMKEILPPVNPPENPPEVRLFGAIIGDIVGSRFEWDNYKCKDFEFVTNECHPTDDSCMTLAVAEAITICYQKGDFSGLEKLAIKKMREIGRIYPNAGYGSHFGKWLKSSKPYPYNSYGNGAAMRVSACGWAAKDLETAIELSRRVTGVTHNHSEGLKGAEATTVCIFMARQGKSIKEIRDYVDKHYYPMNFTLDEIRPTYEFNETCQETVPQAIMAFLESISFVDAIRNAVSIGGDSDTVAAITGSIAEAYYNAQPNDYISEKLLVQAAQHIDARMTKIMADFADAVDKVELRANND